MADLLDEIQLRYACRAFVEDQPVTLVDVALLLEAGRLAPSAFGLEPWRFVVVDDSQRAAVIRACGDQPAATTSAALIAIVALVDALDPDSDYVRDRLLAEARDGEVAPIAQAYRAFYDPTVIKAWAIGQCHFAAAHMLLQAAHMELGSCPIGGFDPVALAAALDLPADETPALVIAFGRCAYPAPPRRRKLD
jgi:nitroreductase